MTHKSFYEAAASEVAAGHLDNALWIKVNAEMPGADGGAKQAKYIALRAQELAVENAGTTLRRWMPRTKGQWTMYWASAFVIAFLILFFVDAVAGHNASTAAFVVAITIAATMAFWSRGRHVA